LKLYQRNVATFHTSKYPLLSLQPLIFMASSAAMEDQPPTPEPGEVDYTSLADPFLTELYRRQPSTANS
jgi:hypothetical protein